MRLHQLIFCGLTISLLAAAPIVISKAMHTPDGAEWTIQEREVLASLHITSLPPADTDPSNSYEQSTRAASLGRRIFFDPRFSTNEKVSCSSCHAPDKGFQDGIELGKGVATGLRRTMPVVESWRGPWLFWDGRKDSLWSQALGPMEDAREHGGNRLAYVRTVAKYYRNEYEAIFSGMPELHNLPMAASPIGSAEERSAWSSLRPAQQDAINRVFANIGKAIAAYEKSLHFAPSRLDTYIAGVLTNESEAAHLLSAPEKRGLRLFMGKANCITCHGGPLFSDQHFHNTGIAPRTGTQPDLGRAAAISKVVSDEFNCLGKYSDAKPSDCQELQFIADDDPRMVGAFKTPSLRNVELRAPYMHAGQVKTLNDVIRHYAQAPRAAVGRSELVPVALSEQEVSDLVSFLGTLSSPIQESISP